MDFKIGDRVRLVTGVSHYLTGETGTVVHVAGHIGVRFDSQPPDVQWTDCEPGELEKDPNFWPAFAEAWNEERFQAYLRKWLDAPDRVLSDIKALCDFLGYDPIVEFATLDRLAWLDYDSGPAQTPPTA